MPSHPQVRFRLACLLAASASAKNLIKGICYGPAPLKDTDGKIPHDDFANSEAEGLWGPRGRDDLQIMKKLGANAVRLYGNDPRLNHTSFLDRASDLQMEVIPGLSDYPFTQMAGNCMTTAYNCYTQIKDQYTSLLRSGYVRADGSYHPALKRLIVINEPDLKIPGMDQPTLFCRAIISAIDAIIDAEKEAKVTTAEKDRPKLTATFSFGICKNCSSDLKNPGLAQMLELRKAMQKPEDYGYEAKNDLSYIYKTRVTNSFNTANPAKDIRPQFLEAYEVQFPNVPVFIGEFHGPEYATGQEVVDILAIAEKSPVLDGISFFEFQVRYDKGGSEMKFGMFGLGTNAIQQIRLEGQEFSVWCLTPVLDKVTNRSVSTELSTGFGGPGLNPDSLCWLDPLKVELTERGYQSILQQSSIDNMMTFVDRIVRHLGGLVSSRDGLRQFATKYAIPAAAATWGTMMSDLGSKPSFADWDDMAACVANRNRSAVDVGDGIAYACVTLANKTTFSCEKDIPKICLDDTYLQADYVYSVYYNLVSSGSNPLLDCFFGDAAIYAHTKTFQQSYMDKTCVVTKDPKTTAVTEVGYRLMVKSNKVAGFVERLLAERNQSVLDQAGFRTFCEPPPKDLADLQARLGSATWTCGGTTGRSCGVPGSTTASPSSGPSPPSTTLLPAPTSPPSNLTALWVALVIIAVVVVGGIAAFVLLRRKAANSTAVPAQERELAVATQQERTAFRQV